MNLNPSAGGERSGARVWLGLAVGILAACSGATPVSSRAPRGVIRAATNDDSRCEYVGRLDREVSEAAGFGSTTATIRRVYRFADEAERTRGTLSCREVDTNNDGLKDVVRFYDEFGEKVRELADANYDGEPDTWTAFSQGQVARIELDSNGDGKIQETRFYVRGELSRIQLDTNGDGKPDIWEIYAGGHLDRMGEDLNFDGRVDRWSRGRDNQPEEAGPAQP